MLNLPLLINILGHAAGALIFAIFLFLLYSGPAWPGIRGRGLPAIAASLSLAWNLGSLVILARGGPPEFWTSLIVAVSFSVLSLLPAVLLQLFLQGRSRALTAGGYLLSGTAVTMHFWEIRGNGAALHQTALLVITIGFLMLTAAAVVRASARKAPGRMRILASMCLALFAMSFIHFGRGHASQVWSSELLVHHIGIPLALFVLLQDYRFVLLDAFVRFLANALLAALFAGCLIFAVLRLDPLVRAGGDAFIGLLLIGVGLLLLLFAWVRSAVQSWLTRVIFRQDGVTNLPRRIQHPPEFGGAAQYLEWAAATIAAAVNTNEYEVAAPAGAETLSELRAPVLAGVLPGAKPWAEAAVPVRWAPGNSKLIFLGKRKGGQRYLSEDLAILERTASEIADHFEVMHRVEMDRLVSQAELRALQSQINPHFLFNALNALYGTVPRQAIAARKMILNLADMFRYFLQSDQTFVPLRKEMEIVKAYLEIEQIRLGDRLTVEIAIDDAALCVPVPVLSIQPLLENAIKHGVSQRAEEGYVRVRGTVTGDELRIIIENNGGETSAAGGTGVGLQNVQRRLEICYGAAGSLPWSGTLRRRLSNSGFPWPL